MGSTDFEAAQKWLEDNDAPKEVLEAFQASPLRAQVEEANKTIATLTQERDDAVSRITKIERAPGLKKALEQLGIDYEKQPRFGKKSLDAFEWEGDEPDLEKLAEYVEAEGFDYTPFEQTTEDKPAAAKIAEQANVGSSRFMKTSSPQEQIAEAEATGDWEKSMALKNKLLLEQSAAS